MKPYLVPYHQLISNFLRGKLTAVEFEAEYSQLFEEDATEFADDELDILNGLLGDVEAFCPDDDIREEDDIDESQLRVAAEQALERLRELPFE